MKKWHSTEVHITTDRYKALARSITQRYGLECDINYMLPNEIFIDKELPLYGIGEIYPARYVLDYVTHDRS